MDNDKRFIEDTFPVKEVSAESTREKNIRHGHISTLHIWWARRPLASSRATSYAALIPAVSREENPDEWTQKRDFISKFSKWENSLNQTMIDKARKEILDANDGKPPKVLDPFAGGGAIPLEALRLGCETYASDYNPVAVLIEKCTLEYPQKYGKPGEVEREVEEFGRKRKIKIKVENKLLEDIKKWGSWVLDETKKEIGKFYPPDEDGSIPVGYIWARTVPCQNPSCGIEIPLMRQYWLARKENKKISLYPSVDAGKITFRIVGDGYEKHPEEFDPTVGTVSRAVVTCPVCSSVVDANTTRKLFRDGKAGQRMVAVVTHKRGISGKRYCVTKEKDTEIFHQVAEHLKEKRDKLMLECGVDPVPDEQLPEERARGFSGFRIILYGMTTWGDLFNARQKLALITFVEKVRQAYQEMLKNMFEEEYAKAVVSYLALAVDMVGAFSNMLARWENTSEAIKQLYSRQALPMLWDFAEVNPFSASSGSYETGWEYYLKVVKHCSKTSNYISFVTQSSATHLPYKDSFFDAIFTDPPYYDNVAYADLSDFFYVWLKRSVGNLYPELFSTPLVPKSQEIIQDPGRSKGKEFFEENLTKSFKEIYRVLKPNGIAVIVYAHKSTEGWETLINSLLDSGLITTGAWPLRTEMRERLVAKETAALASSIYIVARKMQRQPTGFYKKVQVQLKKHIDEKLEQLWQERIAGADFFISAIGSAIEIFGKYEKVMDYEGIIVRADRLLEDVRKIATDYAVRQILHDGFAGEISDLTRFYVLWRWNYRGAKVEFDEANKLARSCGIDLAREWNRPGFIKKEKEFIKLLGPQDRKLDQLTDSTELIDILHEVLLLWEKSKRDEIKNTLGESGYGTSEAFYRVAQAVSETLPNENKEKKLLDGFLAGKERIKDEIKQWRLFK